MVHTLIVSAEGANLRPLIRALRDAEVEEGWIITNNAGESLIGDSTPDFVTAVFNPAADASYAEAPGPGATPFTNLDVAFRAGRAVGQGYPVLLVVPPPLRRPADLTGIVVAPCPLDDFDVLRLHVWAFVSTLPGRTHLSSRPALSPPTDFDATSVLDQLYRIDSKQGMAGVQVERLVASLLSQVGAELVENKGADDSDSRVDLAVLPSRDSGDVVLVEIKAGRLTESGLAAAEQQLQQYVIERHASLGLLLYHDFEGKHLPSRHVTPLVIRVSVRELVAGLKTNSLPQLISGVVRDAIRRM